MYFGDGFVRKQHTNEEQEANEKPVQHREAKSYLSAKNLSKGPETERPEPVRSRSQILQYTHTQT